MDESRWPTANPSLAEGLVEAADIRTGVYGMKGDDLGIAQEYLGYWLPPIEQVEKRLSAKSSGARPRYQPRLLPADSRRLPTA